jgi:hypothetical protein
MLVAAAVELLPGAAGLDDADEDAGDDELLLPHAASRSATTASATRACPRRELTDLISSPHWCV